MEFAERLSVPLRWWVQGTMLVATLWLALVVAVPLAVAWTVTGVALALMVALFVSYGARADRRRRPTCSAPGGPHLDRPRR